MLLNEGTNRLGIQGPRILHAERAGFSLLELMVATVVLLLGILGALVVQTATRDLSQTGHETNLAVSDLAAGMEEVLLTPLAEIPGATGRYPADVPLAQFSDLHLSGQRIVPTYPNFTGAEVPDPLEIVLTCTWSDFAGRARSIRLTTRRTR